MRRPRLSPAPFLLGFLATSFVAVCPGFYFREHYFVLLLPAAALLVGAAIAAARAALPGVPWAPILLLVAALGQGLYAERGLLLAATGREATRLVFGANPFPEAVEVGTYLREHSEPGDRIAVIGSEPEILFYAGRRSATGYIYTYALMEPQRYAAAMQREMVREIEAASPKYAVFVDVPTSWLSGPRSDRWILGWASRFLAEKYDRVGVVDIFPESRYVWGPDAHAYEPQSPYRIFVYARRTLVLTRVEEYSVSGRTAEVVDGADGADGGAAGAGS